MAARERMVVALVLQRDELSDDFAIIGNLPFFEVEDHRRVSLDRADAIEARHRGDDDHIVAFEQRARRRMAHPRSEEHTSELQSLMRISYAVFCLQKKKTNYRPHNTYH